MPEPLRRVALRRKKSEVLTDLPPKQHTYLEINGISKSLARKLGRQHRITGRIATGGVGKQLIPALPQHLVEVLRAAVEPGGGFLLVLLEGRVRVLRS